MKRIFSLSGVIALLIAGAAVMQADNGHGTLVVTATNATANQLLVYNTGGTLIQTVSTGGKGGVSGNAGGIAASGSEVAVVNFGSQSVSVFERSRNGLRLTETIYTASSPVSVAFGANHLYILGTKTVESHAMHQWQDNSSVEIYADGLTNLVLGDGSAAQVGVVTNGLVISEKSNMIETVGLTGQGAVTGAATAVTNIPGNVNAPFGMATRGNNAYVTIAHADEISLVRNGAVLTTTPTSSFSGPLQHAPCWVALDGPYLFSANSPSMSISRWVVYGQNIVADAGVVATLNGAPTDIASKHGLVAVIDGNGPVTHLSIFNADEDGNLTLLQPATTVSGTMNGVAIVEPQQN